MEKPTCHLIGIPFRVGSRKTCVKKNEKHPTSDPQSGSPLLMDNLEFFLGKNCVTSSGFQTNLC